MTSFCTLTRSKRRGRGEGEADQWVQGGGSVRARRGMLCRVSECAGICQESWGEQCSVRLHRVVRAGAIPGATDRTGGAAESIQERTRASRLRAGTRRQLRAAPLSMGSGAFSASSECTQRSPRSLSFHSDVTTIHCSLTDTRYRSLETSFHRPACCDARLTFLRSLCLPVQPGEGDESVGMQYDGFYRGDRWDDYSIDFSS